MVISYATIEGVHCGFVSRRREASLDLGPTTGMLSMHCLGCPLRSGMERFSTDIRSVSGGQAALLLLGLIDCLFQM